MGLVDDGTPFYGIRPESLSVQADPSGQAIVIVVEHFGNSEVLCISAGQLTLKVLVSGASGLAPGNSVKLTVDEKDLFRFQS